MAKAVAKVEEVQAPVPQDGAAIINIFERLARDPTVDPARIQQILELKRGEEDRGARKLFLSDLSGLQAVLPAVERKGTGHNKAKYARFEDFIGTVKPLYTQFRFSLTFRIKQEAGLIRITGVLGHSAGHQEETELALPADNTGNKNAVQALGSSISYGKRYVGMTLLGIATEDEDDDGKAAVSVAKITEDNVSKLRSLIVDTNSDIPRFCRYMEKKTKTKIESLEDIPAASFDDAVAALEAKERGQL
jgi:hypothetical protein